MMKLSQYAKKLGLSYHTVWRMWKRGEIRARQLPTGTVLVEEEINPKIPPLGGVAIYTRVSSNENRSNLKAQADRLKQYAIAKGWKIERIVMEVGSGVNDKRSKLEALLSDKAWGILLVEHRDRLTRFGFNYLKLMLREQGRIIEVVNEAENEREGIVQDFVAVIYSFAAKLYGLRRAKRKTEKILKELQEAENGPEES